jgi:hypothetical protein
MLITQRPHAPRLQYQPGIITNIPPDPPCRKCPENMSMRYNEYIARFRLPIKRFLRVKFPPNFVYEIVHARRHGRGRVTRRTPIAPNIPVRSSLLPDLMRCKTLVVTVVPFGDAVCDFDICVRAGIEAGGGGGGGPREARFAADVEEFEGALGAGAGGDVAVVSQHQLLSLSTCLVLELVWGMEVWERYMCARFLGTINLSEPTRALPVARTRFSPLDVSGMSEVPVWRPLRDHSVSPWRIMKTRGVGMLVLGCN